MIEKVTRVQSGKASEGASKRELEPSWQRFATSRGVCPLLLALALACSQTPPKTTAEAPSAPENEGESPHAAGEAPSAETSAAHTHTVGAPAPQEPRTPQVVELGRAKLTSKEADGWRELALRHEKEQAAVAAPSLPLGSFRPLRTIPFGKSHLTFAELGPGGDWLVAASEAEGVLRHYDAASGKLLAELQVPGFEAYGRSAFLSWPLAQERPVVLEVSDRGHVLLDVAGGTVVPLDDASGWALRLSQSERFVGSAVARLPAQTSSLRFARPVAKPGLEPVLTLELSERADDWVLVRGERVLALLYYPSEQIELLDLVERRVMGVLPAPKYASSIDVTPDERLLAVGGEALWLYDLRTGERVSTDERFDNNIGRVRFSPSGDRLVVTAYDGKARSYTMTDDRLGERQLLAHRGTANVYAASFSRDGRRLVTSSGDQTVKVWER